MFQRSQGPHRQDKACKINLGQLYTLKKKAPFPYNGKHLPTNIRKKTDLNEMYINDVIFDTVWFLLSD